MFVKAVTHHDVGMSLYIYCSILFAVKLAMRHGILFIGLHWPLSKLFLFDVVLFFYIPKIPAYTTSPTQIYPSKRVSSCSRGRQRNLRCTSTYNVAVAHAIHSNTATCLFVRAPLVTEKTNTKIIQHLSQGGGNIACFVGKRVSFDQGIGYYVCFVGKRVSFDQVIVSPFTGWSNGRIASNSLYFIVVQNKIASSTDLGELFCRGLEPRTFPPITTVKFDDLSFPWVDLEKTFLGIPRRKDACSDRGTRTFRVKRFLNDGAP